MELGTKEVAAVIEAAAKADQKEICPLGDLQLALIGGGIGDVVWG